jgi:hypothetical protein
LNYATYACSKNDQALYEKVLNEAVTAEDPDPNLRLQNTIAKRRAKRMLTKAAMENCGFTTPTPAPKAAATPPPDKPAEKPPEKPADKPAEKPAAKPADKPAPPPAKPPTDKAATPAPPSSGSPGNTGKPATPSK